MLHSCPCGYQSKRENVKRHMSTCKRIKAAERVTDGISDVNERLVVTEEKLAAKEALLDAATKRASELTEENSSLKNENKQLKKQVKEKASTTVNITNNITNINVTIAPFQGFHKNGAARLCDMPAVPDDQVRRLLLTPAMSVPKYIALKYLETETPSLRIPNVSRSYMEVVQKERDGICRWVRVDKGDTLDRMVEAGAEDLTGNYGGLQNMMCAKWFDEWWPLDYQAKSRKAIAKRWKRDVEHMILNKRKCMQQRGV